MKISKQKLSVLIGKGGGRLWCHYCLKELGEVLRHEIQGVDPFGPDFYYEVLSSGPYTIGHIIPRIRGGTNHIDNLVIACHPCNSSKGIRSYDTFLKYIYLKNDVDIPGLMSLSLTDQKLTLSIDRNTKLSDVAKIIDMELST